MTSPTNVPPLLQTKWQEAQFIFRETFSPATPLGALFYFILFGFLAWIGGRALRLAVHRVLEKNTEGVLDPTTVRFLGQLAKLFVYIFAFASYAHIIPALKSLGTGWLASLGVVSVVVGLAAQNTLGNLIAGISLVLYRPFKIGDQVQVSAPSGLETATVEAVNLGYTILRTDDERRLVIPNSLIASQTSINLTLTSPVCSVTIKLNYDANVEKAQKILLDIVRSHANSTGEPTCRLTALTPAGVTLTLTAQPKDPRKVLQMSWDILESAKRQFDAAGIGFQRDNLGPGK